MYNLERIQHTELEAMNFAGNSYSFDSTKINLISANRETLEFCNEYFELYARVDALTQGCDWTVRELLDPSAQEHYWEVDESSKLVTIRGNESNSRLTMRIARSLVMLEDINSGKVMFKGGAFKNKDGQGIALMGEKRSGKTSFLLGYMLSNDHVSRFITNSHVAVGFEDDQVFAYGYPMSVGVRLNVLEAMQKRGNDGVIPIIDDLKRNLQPGEENRYYIDPDRLSNHFGGRIACKTRLDKIILVKSVSADSFSGIKKLTASDIESYFKNYYLRHIKSDGWYKLFDAEVKQQMDSIRNILEQTDIYELTFHVNSHTDNIELVDQI